jgi:UMP-CMP kinase
MSPLDGLIFVSLLGGPGSGKGTQCKKLAEVFDVEHISIGDLCRAEVERPGSPWVEILRHNLREGKIGSNEMTVGILRDHILRVAQHDKKIFVLDGMPGRYLCDADGPG